MMYENASRDIEQMDIHDILKVFERLKLKFIQVTLYLMFQGRYLMN